MSFETTTDEVLEGVDLGGKIAVVTGASTGLGLETARALASAGAEVVLAGRDSSHASTPPRRRSWSVSRTRELEQGLLDLTSLESVRAFAEWYANGHDRLHLLVNNAGVMYTPFEHTAEGFEMQFGTNHVGHFLLTCLLGAAAARRSAVARRQPQLRRAQGLRHRVGRHQLRATRLRQVRRVRAVEDRQHPVLGRARPSTRPTAACTRTRCTRA